MKMTIPTFAITAIFLAAGCATGGAVLKKPAGPSITGIQVDLTSLDPAVGAADETEKPDFVLLKVDVENPEAVDARGIIACLKEHKVRQRPLQHRFDLPPEEQSQYRVPVDALQVSGYTLRCRLEFQDDLGNEQREPSPWVKVRVPARS